MKLGSTRNLQILDRLAMAACVVATMVSVGALLTGCSEQGQQRTERAQENWDGQAALQKHDYPKAIEAFTHLIEQNPKRGEYYVGRAQAYMGVSDYDKAIADCKKAEEFKLQSSSLLGKIELCQGHAAEAAEQFRKKLDSAPETPNLEDAVYCALAYKLADKDAEAEKIAARAMANYAKDSYVMAHKNDDNAQKYVWEKWPYPALQYLRGQIDGGKMVATAADSEWDLPEAHCVSGMNLVAKAPKDAADKTTPDDGPTDTAAAVKELNFVLEHSTPDRFINQLAKSQLARMQTDSPKPTGSEPAPAGSDSTPAGSDSAPSAPAH
jgi:tetratricopeptide (TPR) repeat protein